MTPIEIPLREARSFIINSQLLGRSPFRKSDLLHVIEHLGYIQIDTISVIERAHHHILWTRVRNYNKELLRKLESSGKVFEYWSHAASYLPMCDYKYSLFHKNKIKKGSGHWRPRDKKWMKHVYDKIKIEGPQKVRDFKKDPSLNESHAWGGHPVTQGLRQLFMEGSIMISGREGFQKIYDLTERVLPAEVDTSIPSESSYYKYLITRDLRANGLMKATEIGHLITIPRKKLEILLAELEEDGIINQLRLYRQEATKYYGLTKTIENNSTSRSKKRLHLLSPFDNLIIQRKRLMEFFNFEYVLECYVPTAKRKFGYFGLPLLWGKEFVGQIDLKADRKHSQLIVNKVELKTNIRSEDKLNYELSKKLNQFALFNDCNEVIGFN